MPRSLNQAGLGKAPVWVKTEHVVDQPFYVMGATTRGSKFGEQTVFKLRLRDGVYDADGVHHKDVHLSLKHGEGQREDMVNYFRLSNDPLGPLMIQEVPTKAGLNPFIMMIDCDANTLPKMRELPVLDAPKERAAYDEGSVDAELAELPF